MIKKTLSRKFYLRLFSLLFSLFIWLYVVSSAEIEVDKSIEIKIQAPESLAFKNILPKEVILRLRGPRLFVQRFIDSKQEMIIKVEDYYTKGRNIYSIKLASFYPKTPLGIEVISKNIRSVDIQLEKKAKKRVPIVLSVPEGSKERVQRLDPVLSQKYIYIEGAKSLVRRITKVRTEVIDLSEAKSDQVESVLLEIPITNVQYEFTHVDISYKGLINYEEFTYANIPIIFHSEKLITSSSARSVDIRVYGSRMSLKKALREQIKAVVELGSKNNSDSIPIKMILPEGLELRSVSPESVKVKTE